MSWHRPGAEQVVFFFHHRLPFEMPVRVRRRALKVATGSDEADGAQTCIIRRVPEHPRVPRVESGGARWRWRRWGARTSSPEARPWNRRRIHCTRMRAVSPRPLYPHSRFHLTISQVTRTPYACLLTTMIHCTISWMHVSTSHEVSQTRNIY